MAWHAWPDTYRQSKKSQFEHVHHIQLSHAFIQVGTPDRLLETLLAIYDFLCLVDPLKHG